MPPTPAATPAGGGRVAAATGFLTAGAAGPAGPGLDAADLVRVAGHAPSATILGQLRTHRERVEPAAGGR